MNIRASSKRSAASTTPKRTTTRRISSRRSRASTSRRALWLEADRMGSLNVDEANFKSERQVVEEERRVRVDNQPYGTIEEDLRAAAFTRPRLSPHAHREHRGFGQCDRGGRSDLSTTPTTSRTTPRSSSSGISIPTRLSPGPRNISKAFPLPPNRFRDATRPNRRKRKSAW